MKIFSLWTRRSQIQRLKFLRDILLDMERILDEEPDWRRTPIDEGLMRREIEDFIGVIGESMVSLARGALPIVYRSAIFRAEIRIIEGYDSLAGAKNGKQKFREWING